MALSKEQWDEVTKAMETLRGLGCAVCVFTPDDVETAHDDRQSDDADVEDGAEIDRAEMTDDESKAWMERNRRYMEDTLSTAGNLFIADNLNAVPA